MRILKNNDLLELLACPRCFSKMYLNNEIIECSICHRQFTQNNGIPNFVMDDYLDDMNNTEVVGNGLDIRDEGQVDLLIYPKGHNNLTHMFFAKHKIEAMLKFLSMFGDNKVLFDLGAGAGYEIEKILPVLKFKTVLVSDIQPLRLGFIPQRVSQFEGNIGLFASEFRHSPVPRDSKNIGLVYEALHHTSDCHHTLEKLLDRFDTLVFVEPITNWLLEILTKLGYAKRREYSGSIPNWMEIKKIKQIARKRKYNCKIHTLWECPYDFIPGFIKNNAMCLNALLYFVKMLSIIGQPFNFGSFGIVVLYK
jgi:uncharacterized protein YbaR (Trm112 family)